jgi:uncharacterized cupin superfamily protein
MKIKLLLGALLLMVGAAFGQSQFSGGGQTPIPAPSGSGLCLVSTGAASGDFTFQACPGGAINQTQYALAYYPTTTTLGSLLGVVSGQNLVAVNGAAPSFISPGLLDSTSSPVSSTPYLVQCDSATTLIDRAHVVRLQSGASAVTIPLSTATGCSGGFITELFDDGAGTVTVSASSPDTFSVFNGSSNVDGATSFTLTNGQSAVLSQGASGLWEVRIGINTGFTGDGTIFSSTPSPTGVATLTTPVGGTVLNNNTAAAAAPVYTPNIVLGVSSAGGSPATGSVKLLNSGNTGSVTLQAGSSTNNAVATVPPNAASETVWVNAGTNSIGTTGATLDLSTATGTAAFKIPQTAGMTASAAGAFTFDTTNKNYHGYVNGADSIFLNIAAAPATNTILKSTVASGNTLETSSAITDNGITVSTTEAVTIGSSGQFAVSAAGLVTKSNNVSTAGQGYATIQCVTAQKAETGTADASVLSCTPASAAGSYRIRVSIVVSSATSGIIGWTATWTDAAGTAVAPTELSLFQSGTAAPALTFTTSAASDYYGEAQIDVNNAGTAIVVKWIGGGTTVAKITATIERLI